jgi:hypothetical protein
MNKEERQRQINDTLRDLHWKLGNRSGSHINCIRFNPTNTKEHEMKKADICYELQKLDKPFITEPELEGYGRPDILNILDYEFIEIVCSESEESLEAKSKKYPQDSTITRVYVKKKQEVVE